LSTNYFIINNLITVGTYLILLRHQVTLCQQSLSNLKYKMLILIINISPHLSYVQRQIVDLPHQDFKFLSAINKETAHSTKSFVPYFLFSLQYIHYKQIKLKRYWFFYDHFLIDRLRSELFFFCKLLFYIIELKLNTFITVTHITSNVQQSGTHLSTFFKVDGKL